MFSNPQPRKEIEKPSQFAYPICKTIRLAISNVFPSISFIDVIEKRTSSRSFRGVSKEQLSNLLWLTCKVKDVAIDSAGYVLSHRSSASAGGRHPIDVLVLSRMHEETPVLHYYNPFEHTLNELSVDVRRVEDLITHVRYSMELDNATILWFIAHPSRTAAKYENAISLIWRDAGALIHSIQLASAFYNLNSCALGTLGEPYISNLFSNNTEVWSAGGILIG